MSALNSTLGILFDMQIFEALLYGAGMVQAWFYYSTYVKKDHIIIKLLVTVVFILDTIQVVMVFVLGYRYFVTDLAVIFEALQAGHLIQYPLDEVQLTFTCFIALFTQHFYCWRIYMILRSNQIPYARLLTGVLSLLSCGANGTWLAYTIIATRKDYFNQLIELQHLLTVTNTLTAVTDIAISAVMIYLLQISKTGFQRSTDLLNRLIIFTFGTGLPTALSALLSAITANTNPNTLIYALFNAFLGRFYTNCLLVNLNARDYIRGMNNTTLSDVEDIQLSARSCSSRNGTRSNTFRINVETTTNVFRSDTNANNTMDILRSYDSKGEP